MDTDSWQRLKDLFHEAQDLPPAAWPEFAAERCPDQAERDQLLALLATDTDAPSDFLRSPVAPPSETETIADYELGRVVGVGGMGTVYAATQRSPRRTVALKVMRSVGVDQKQIRRLEAEAEILGRLQHPNIAQVYAAGTHEVRGLQVPWFAMELVEGALPITDFVHNRQLSRDERIRLFLEVCDAVQHAHQKGVIHRDLKPGNILVDGEGVPRIIDFGVARAIGADQPDSLRTQAGELIGTLAYMSPEQCCGDREAVDTRADIYALGIVLYEMVTGQLPFDVVGKPLTEAIRTIDDSPPRRSERLAGDLEAIAFMALQKEPQRRYASVEALADDIRRHLDNEPINARPPSLRYHLRLFARRNRTLVAAITLATIGLVTAAVVSTHFAVEASQRAEEANHARKVADEERDAADETLNVLMAAIQHANPMVKPRDIPVSELLDQISERNANAPRTPRIRARIYFVLASATNGTGQHEAAIEHAGKSLRAIAEIPGGNDPLQRQVLEVLGMARMRLGQLDEAESELRKALALTENDANALEARVSLLSRIAGLQSQRREWDQAEATLTEALTCSREHDVGGTALAEACANLGTVRFTRGDFARAKELWQRSLELFDQSLWPDHPVVMQVRSNYGLILQREGRHGEAELEFELARDIAIERYGNDSPHVANAWHKLAFLHIDQNNWQAGEHAANEMLRIRRNVYGDDPRQVGMAHQCMGYLKLYEGKYEDAIAAFERALHLHNQGLADNDADMAGTRLLLGRALMRANRHTDALPHLQAAVQVRTGAFGEQAVPTLMAKHALGWCWLRHDRVEEAELAMRSIYPIIEQRVGRAHIEIKAARMRMAELCDVTGKHDEAAAWRTAASHATDK